MPRSDHAPKSRPVRDAERSIRSAGSLRLPSPHLRRDERDRAGRLRSAAGGLRAPDLDPPRQPLHAGQWPWPYLERGGSGMSTVAMPPASLTEASPFRSVRSGRAASQNVGNATLSLLRTLTNRSSRGVRRSRPRRRAGRGSHRADEARQGTRPPDRARGSRSGGGFVRLDGGAAGAEPLRLPPCVLELGARVGV